MLKKISIVQFISKKRPPPFQHLHKTPSVSQMNIWRILLCQFRKWCARIENNEKKKTNDLLFYARRTSLRIWEDFARVWVRFRSSKRVSLCLWAFEGEFLVWICSQRWKRIQKFLEMVTKWKFKRKILIENCFYVVAGFFLKVTEKIYD